MHICVSIMHAYILTCIEGMKTNTIHDIMNTYLRKNS